MKIQIAALFGILLFPTLALSQSHCHKGEVVYFSCQTTQTEKVISICGSAINDEPSDDSWLQYRFGQIGKIELTYPIEKKGSIQKFEGIYFNRYNVVSLRFINNKTLYDVSDSMGREDENSHEQILPSAGITVSLSKTKSLNIKCKNIYHGPHFGSFTQLAISLGQQNGETDFLSDFYNKVSK
jgi:hypothetical protein